MNILHGGKGMFMLHLHCNGRVSERRGRSSQLQLVKFRFGDFGSTTMTVSVAKLATVGNSRIFALDISRVSKARTLPLRFLQGMQLRHPRDPYGLFPPGRLVAYESTTPCCGNI